VTVVVKMVDVVYNQPVTELYAELQSGSSRLSTKTDMFGVLRFTSTPTNPLVDGQIATLKIADTRFKDFTDSFNI
jgi:hypothetical protein